MTETRFLRSLLCSLSAASIVGSAAVASAPEDAKLRAELESIARRRVFFGHQSVGANIVEGLLELSSRAHAPLRIVEASEPLGLPGGTFAHGLVAANGNPALKLETFTRIVGSLPASGLDVALLKFCFVDIDSSTDAAALFAKYKATIAALQARHPRTTFVHVTVPLTTVQGGIKALAKRLLGRPVYGIAENARRDEYNTLLRNAFLGREPVFDLARIESTAPDGSAEGVDWMGRSIPALVAAYTDDGGHLDREGRLRAARELISVLASIPAGRLAAGEGGAR